MLRKIYIIGHKANTIADAVEFLKEGANGIETDICYIENTKEKFYVYEKLPGSEDDKQELFHRIMRGEVSSLKNYLHALSDFLITSPRFRLSIISFDLVPPYNFDINHLYCIIREEFVKVFPSTAILTRVSQPASMTFLAALEQQYPNEAVSIDENVTPKEAGEYFGRLNLNYGFGTGSDVPGLSSSADTFTDRARIAVSVKEREPAGGLKIIHAWIVNSERSMKTYLDIGVDAIVTDKPGRLKNLVESQLYKGKYFPADTSHEPFQ